MLNEKRLIEGLINSLEFNSFKLIYKKPTSLNSKQQTLTNSRTHPEEELDHYILKSETALTIK